MPICPFCQRTVSVTNRGYIRKHGTSKWSPDPCKATGLSVDGAKQYLVDLDRPKQQQTEK